MRKYFFITALLFLAAPGFSAEVREVEIPVAVNEYRGFTSADISGDWVGYWASDVRYLERSSTSFIFAPDGVWQIARVVDGERTIEDAGSYRITDSHVIFKPKGVEEGEIIALVLDFSRFMLKAEGQDTAMIYRRRDTIPAASHTELKGKWLIYVEKTGEAGQRELEKAPFYMEFDGIGRYKLVSTSSDFIIPEVDAQGKYKLSSDGVVLENMNGEDNMEFFLDRTMLIPNSRAAGFFAQKEE